MQSYKLSASATKKIALNLDALQKAFPDYEAKRSEILRETGNPAETDPGYKLVVAAFDRWVKETPLMVEFNKLKYEELNIGESDRQNHIPPVVVTHLFPILDLSEGQ